jgi:hypothetical protein
VKVMGLMTPTEILNDRDKTFGVAKDETVASNALSVEIAAVAGKRHYIGSIVLTGTAGTGGAEALKIKKGATVVWQEAFTVGADKVRQFQAVPLVGNPGETVTVEASATNLTAGKLYVVYYTK